MGKRGKMMYVPFELITERSNIQAEDHIVSQVEAIRKLVRNAIYGRQEKKKRNGGGN